MGPGVVAHGLMPAGMIVPVFMAVVCAPVTSYAAIYEFTLEGEVTFSLLGSNPSVGDPVTIKYVADSKDLNPDPRVGRYAATGASMEMPHITYPALGDGRLEVFTTADRLDYQCGIQDPQAPAPWLLDITIAYPDGTFQSDALPLSLPLSDAVVRRFVVIPIFTELFRGNITSYTSVEIPEPKCAGLLLLTMILTRRFSTKE